MLWMLWAACGGELEPGDVGFEDCNPVDLSPFGCDDVQTCCLQTTEVDQECRVVMEGGEEIPCTDSACIAAVAEVVDSCATDTGTTPTGGGCDFQGTWDLDVITCNGFAIDTWFDDEVAHVAEEGGLKAGEGGALVHEGSGCHWVGVGCDGHPCDGEGEGGRDAVRHSRRRGGGGLLRACAPAGAPPTTGAP